jgi:hypothetical protein
MTIPLGGVAAVSAVGLFAHAVTLLEEVSFHGGAYRATIEGRADGLTLISGLARRESMAGHNAASMISGQARLERLDGMV